MPTKLSINLNKIATIRNARGGVIPSVIEAAKVCIEAGCHGITVHPRPDGRHIRRDDVFELAELLRSHPGIEFNIEGYPSPEHLLLLAEIKPTQATFVPDPPDTLTSNAGWKLEDPRNEFLKEILAQQREAGARTSVFIDADPRQAELAAQYGADRVELYTEPYARAMESGSQAASAKQFAATAAAATRAGIGINAGHDLNRDNLSYFVSQVPNLLEVSIGHALISDAIFIGLHATVLMYLRELGYEI